MPHFEYTARDKTGKLVHGSTEATDRDEAASALFAKNLTPVKISGHEKKSGLNLSMIKRKGVPMEEKVIFSRQFATMIGAGVPIVKSIAILRNQSSSPVMKDALNHILKTVEGGGTLSSALAQYPNIFSPTYVSMVKAGEVGGILEQVLDRLATQIEKDHDLVAKVRGAMIYPSVIFVVMTGAFFFIMTVIVPQLAVVFAQMGGELPWYTKSLLSLSHILTHYGFLVIIGIAAVVYGLIRYRKTPGGRHLFDRFTLKLPIFGAIVRKVNLARFSRTLSSLMAAGIPVLDALEVVAKSLGNTIIRDEILEIAGAVKNGSSIAKPLAHSKNFPPIVSEMVAVGEETGKLDDILAKLASFYEKEVDTVVASISSIIEPILMIVMGVMVGFIVISVIGPLYQLTSSIWCNR